MNAYSPPPDNPGKIDSFLGIHNVNPARSIPNNALVDAVNVNIDSAGKIFRRQGYSLALSIPISTAYTTLDRRSFIVSAGVLYRVLPDFTLVRIVESTATQFCDDGQVLFTNDALMVEPNDDVYSLDLPAPQNPPLLSTTVGGLPTGRYSAVYTIKDVNGRESGCSPVATIELDDFNGISVNHPGDAFIPAGFTTVFYLTDANGTVYYTPDGDRLNEHQVSVQSFPPDAEIIAFHNSSLYVSRLLPGGMTQLLFSHPFLPHLFDWAKQYVIVPGHIRAMMSTPQGLLIGTDAAIYAYTDALVPLATYGVPPGRPFCKNKNGIVYMHTNRGVCTAFPFTNLTEQKTRYPSSSACSTAIVEQDGATNFLTLTDGAGVTFNQR